MASNPILERELRSRWRRPLTYVILCLYAGLLSWVAWQLSGAALMQSAQLVEGFGGDEAVRLPGAELFEKSVKAQVLVALWAAALLCAPVIARERELKMLPELVLANLSPSKIVRGKWLATLGFALVLLLIPLPLQALAFLLGGVSPGEWGAAALLQVGAMILGSAVGLGCSARSYRVANAMGTTAMAALGCSIPLGLGLLQPDAGVMSCMAMACALASVPLIYGAQRAVEKLPLDPPRIETVDLPSSPSQPAPLAHQIAREAAKNHQRDEENPESCPSWGKVEAAAREELKVYGMRRESWVFPLLRALNLHNPLVWRELRVRTREPFFDGASMLIGLAALALLPWGLATLFASQPRDAFAMVVAVWVLVGASCAIRASQGFTREREQRMLESLLLSTMSPLSIVSGKMLAPIVLCLYAGAVPLALFAIGMLGWGLSQSALSASVALVGLACFAILGAACGTWLSFWCRTSSVSTAGSLVMFAMILSAPGVGSILGSERLQRLVADLWISPVMEPLFLFDGSPSFALGALGLFGVVLGISILLLGHISRALRPQAVDHAAGSFLHTDLTRNLR